MDLALKALIIKAVDAVYLEEKRDRYTGFLAVTARDIMNHLLQRHGRSHGQQAQNGQTI